MKLRLPLFAARLARRLLAGSLVVGTILVSAHQADRQLRLDLLQKTTMIAQAVDPQLIPELTGTDADRNLPAYHQIKEQLAAIRSSDSKFRFLYLIGKQPAGPVVFLVDAEPDSSPDFSPPGQEYSEATPQLMETFAAGHASVEGPVRDRWGTWVSAMVPLRLPEHGFRVMLGVDVDARNWHRIVAIHTLLPASLASIAILLGALSLGLFRSRQTLRHHQAALLESERRYAELADQSRTYIWEVDPQGLFTFVSPVVEKVLGYRPDEIIGHRHFYDLHPTEGRDIFRQTVLQIIARHEPFFNFENPVEARAGHLVWTLTNGLPLLHPDGSLRGYRGSNLDITERKRALDALRTSESKLSALFESMNEMAVLHEMIFDTQGEPVDYRLTDCNAAFCQITGIPREKAVGHLATEVYGSPSAPYLAEYAQVVRSAQTTKFETFYKPMDKYFWISAVPLGPGRFATITADITELRQSEQRIRALLEESYRARNALLGILEDQNRTQADLKRLATAFEQSAESIVVTDARACIQYVNPAFEKVTGYNRAEAIGRNPRILQSGRHGTAFYREMWTALASGKTWQGRLINKRKDGTSYTEDAVISPVIDNAGHVVNYVAVKRDISEQLRLSEQLQQSQKMDSVGRLAGGVAHDFNNMLTVILGHAGMALDKLPPRSTVHAHLTEIRDAAQRSADLTRQLLAFARLQTIAPRILNLNQTVDGMLKMIKRLIGENILLRWNPAPDLWPVRMDPSQIDQILVNLCVNSRDAISGSGEIAIATETASLNMTDCTKHPDAIPGDYAVLAVRDTGCGMDAHTLSKLFEPFFTTKRFGEGTGLGLSTVYGIVRQNRGFIEVQSTPGQGSVFRIYLPRYAESESSAPATELPLVGGSETLLLVEDDYGLLQIATQMLQDVGYSVLATDSPGRALHLIEEHPEKIDLLITDVVMPGMNGRMLADRIAILRPGIKVLFVSGYTADIIARNGVLEEGVFFIPKPFSQRALAAKVRERLDSTD